MKRPSNRMIYIGIAIVLATGIAIEASRFLPTPPDDVQIMDLYEEVREAQLDDDYDDIWDVMSEDGQRSYVDELADWQAKGASTTEDREFWRGMHESYGVRREDVLSMDARDWFILSAPGTLDSRPEKRASIEGLVVKAVEVGDGRMARVVLVPVDDTETSFCFDRVDGEWRFHGWMTVAPARMMFKDRTE